MPETGSESEILDPFFFLPFLGFWIGWLSTSSSWGSSGEVPVASLTTSVAGSWLTDVSVSASSGAGVSGSTREGCSSTAGVVTPETVSDIEAFFPFLPFFFLAGRLTLSSAWGSRGISGTGLGSSTRTEEDGCSIVGSSRASRVGSWSTTGSSTTGVGSSTAAGGSSGAGVAGSGTGSGSGSRAAFFPFFPFFFFAGTADVSSACACSETSGAGDSSVIKDEEGSVAASSRREGDSTTGACEMVGSSTAIGVRSSTEGEEGEAESASRVAFFPFFPFLFLAGPASVSSGCASFGTSRAGSSSMGAEGSSAIASSTAAGSSAAAACTATSSSTATRAGSSTTIEAGSSVVGVEEEGTGSDSRAVFLPFLPFFFLTGSSTASSGWTSLETSGARLASSGIARGACSVVVSSRGEGGSMAVFWEGVGSSTTGSSSATGGSSAASSPSTTTGSSRTGGTSTTGSSTARVTGSEEASDSKTLEPFFFLSFLAFLTGRSELCSACSCGVSGTDAGSSTTNDSCSANSGIGAGSSTMAAERCSVASSDSCWMVSAGVSAGDSVATS